MKGQGCGPQGCADIANYIGAKLQKSDFRLQRIFSLVGRYLLQVLAATY